MANDNNCALCGSKLEERGKPKVEYEVKKFGAKLRKVCKGCLSDTPSKPSEEKKK